MQIEYSVSRYKKGNLWLQISALVLVSHNPTSFALYRRGAPLPFRGVLLHFPGSLILKVSLSGYRATIWKNEPLVSHVF